jgi:hypothetical protein
MVSQIDENDIGLVARSETNGIGRNAGFPNDHQARSALYEKAQAGARDWLVADDENPYRLTDR